MYEPTPLSEGTGLVLYLDPWDESGLLDINTGGISKGTRWVCGGGWGSHILRVDVGHSPGRADGSSSIIGRVVVGTRRPCILHPRQAWSLCPVWTSQGSSRAWRDTTTGTSPIQGSSRGGRPVLGQDHRGQIRALAAGMQKAWRLWSVLRDGPHAQNLTIGDQLVDGGWGMPPLLHGRS